MENKRLVKRLSFLLALSCLFTSLIGCGSQKQDKEVTEEMITQTINASNPAVDVHVGPYEHLENREVEDVEGYNQTLSSSTILDMPIDEVINVIYSSDTPSVQSLPSLFNNLVNANKELETIAVTDRYGNHLTKGNGLLSTDGSKISISNPTGYQYGEVYKISIRNADYLAFENKDASIRTLTIEIEDAPGESKTYNEKEIKPNILEFDRDKVSNKQFDERLQLYSFEYASASLPGPIEMDDVFYVTKHNNPDPKLDFYGVFFYITYVDKDMTRMKVTYKAPEMSDIYNELRLKGEKEVSFDDAEILLNDELALQAFKGSALANGIARACLPLVDNNLNQLSNILSNFQIHFDVDHYNNRVSMLFRAGIYGYKVANKYYLNVEFAYEKITDYYVDFDVSIKTKLKVIPVGVNYKIKCIEDVQEIYYLKSSVSYSLAPEGQSEKDFTEQIAREIEAWKNDDKASAISAFGKDPQAQATTSGTRTSWPIIVVDIYYFAPISMRLKAELYVDAGFQAMAMFRQETHSTKVDFCFSNYEGCDTDSANTIDKTSNWMLIFAGNIHFEVGVRASFSLSILGMHDYLHAEAYAEIYLNASISGMILADVSLRETSTDFSGYICVDAALVSGCRVGLDFKCLILNRNVNYTLWYVYLLRIKYENTLEHWSDLSDNEINMEGQTVSLDSYNVLWIDAFNAVTMGFEEKKHKANETFSIFSGILTDPAFIDLTSGHVFEYTVLDHPEWISIDKNGTIHVNDATPSQFDARIRIGVSNWVGTISDKTITVHYTASDAKEAYIVGAVCGSVYLGDYRPGYTFTVPEAPKIRGFAFDAYIWNDHIYHLGDKVTMGNETMILEAYYRVLPTYTVNFYDGLGILVATDVVYEGEDATPPSPEMRDRYTDVGRYEFVSWNRGFTNVHANIDVYGIYIGIKEVK